MTIGHANIMCLGSQRRCGPKHMIRGTYNRRDDEWMSWCTYCDNAILVKNHRFTDHRKDGQPIDGRTINRGTRTSRVTGYIQDELELVEPEPLGDPPF